MEEYHGKPIGKPPDSAVLAENRRNGVSRVSHVFRTNETGFAAYLCGILKTVSLFRSISLLSVCVWGGSRG